MKLLKIYKGTIKFFHGTQAKIAIFTDGKNIKVFQKEFFLNNCGCNNYGLANWSRNVILESKYKTIKTLEESLVSNNFVCIRQ